MSSPAFYPKFRATDPSTGLALVGGKLYTYAAGTTTPLATYSDAALTSANANPVILDANGEASIYVGPSSYKFVLQDSTGAAIWTFDNYAPNLATPSPYPSGWVQYVGTITFVNTTNFSVSGDQTTTFTVGRRVRSSNTAGTIYSTISASSFAAGITTVTIINDSGTLDSGLSAVYYGIETYSNPSYLDPRSSVFATFTADVTGYAADTLLSAWTEAIDALGEFSAGVFTAKYPGYYTIAVTGCVFDTALGTRTVSVRKNGVTANSLTLTITANSQIAYPLNATYLLSAGETLSVYALGAATTTVKGALTMVNITRLR